MLNAALLCFQVVPTGAKPPHGLPGLALYWWILGQEVQPAAGHLLTHTSCNINCLKYRESTSNTSRVLNLRGLTHINDDKNSLSNVSCSKMERLDLK